jgi:hypothetical protein
LLLSLSLSLFLWVSSEFHRTKKTRRRWKSTSNEEVGFVCAPFRFRVSGRGRVGRVFYSDDNRRILFLIVQESEIRRFSMTSKNREHIERDLRIHKGIFIR